MFTDAMTNLFTDDMDRAFQFYSELIGCQQTYQYPATGKPDHVEFRLGSFRLALSKRTAAAGVGLPEPTLGNPAELVFWCDDVASELTKLTAAGSPILVQPMEHVAGNRRATVADPDGNWVTLVCKQ